MQKLQDEHPSPVPVLRGVSEMLRQNCKTSTHTANAVYMLYILHHTVCASVQTEDILPLALVSTLLGPVSPPVSDEHTARLSTAVSRMPQSASCSLSVSPHSYPHMHHILMFSFARIFRLFTKISRLLSAMSFVHRGKLNTGMQFFSSVYSLIASQSYSTSW